MAKYNLEINSLTKQLAKLRKALNGLSKLPSTRRLPLVAPRSRGKNPILTNHRRIPPQLDGQFRAQQDVTHLAALHSRSERKFAILPFIQSELQTDKLIL